MKYDLICIKYVIYIYKNKMEHNGYYKCEFCGNIVQLVYNWWWDLYCCWAKMDLLIWKTQDSLKEKHLPVVVNNWDSLEVQVGSELHPMEENHYIQWIEIRYENYIQRHYLYPWNLPKASFVLKSGKYEIYEYCNIHWLWKL